MFIRCWMRWPYQLGKTNNSHSTQLPIENVSRTMLQNSITLGNYKMCIHLLDRLADGQVLYI